ncbi:hypothetical protein BpHYR1_034602 [Brachionus plicatilis]|uniref:Uncharacterized protein n=1 Tax=Brachionus plicatilis TaxID=10195 RepID=A0A3M7SZK4_BRAPC|nr:hypothetical protein BpHYR1_034602 [Brachionus plicatilis]
MTTLITTWNRKKNHVATIKSIYLTLSYDFYAALSKTHLSAYLTSPEPTLIEQTNKSPYKLLDYRIQGNFKDYSLDRSKSIYKNLTILILKKFNPVAWILANKAKK